MAGVKKVYGPYKGSKQKGGRPLYVIRKKDGSTTSTHKARYEYEKRTGRSLPKSSEVDHKNGNKKDDRASNLRVMSKSKNVAKGNKERTRRKAPRKA